MNEPHIPAELNALDELASAIVDGEAVLPADADRALVERVAAMRTACSAIAAPVDPPTASVREAGIAAALGASVTSTDVHSLATRRRRPRAVPAAAVAAWFGFWVRERFDKMIFHEMRFEEMRFHKPRSYDLMI